MKPESPQLPAAPWALSHKEILNQFGVSLEEGLSSSETRKRYHAFGPNRIEEKKPTPAWVIFVNQLKNIIVALLGAACAVSFLFGKWLEGLSIGIALLLNVFIGFFMELKARRSLESLKQMTRIETRVIRNGRSRKISSSKLVPGDIVEIEAGDMITADLRLCEASRLQANESVLTGESLPVRKETAPQDEDTPLHDRQNMMFKGTAVTMGSAKAVVVATGMNTELGRIASLAEEADEEKTPLEKRLASLGYRLIWVTLAITALVVISGLFTHLDLVVVLETAIALAVAAIPEGLPVVATIALANGMRRMAYHNALINRLSSVETLGATSVIFSDKTGTLTENRMTVTTLAHCSQSGHHRVSLEEDDSGHISLSPGEDSPDSDKDGFPTELVELGVLCSNATLDREDPMAADKAIGDPMEIALLVLGERTGIQRDSLLETFPEVREIAFDPERKMMATVHKTDGSYRYAVKGAPEAVFDVCTSCTFPDGERPMKENARDSLKDLNLDMAREGLRVLAIAGKKEETKDADPYAELCLYGLVGFLDPPRAEVKDAIDACRKSGIRVIMVTGDQEETARHIGRQIGIIDEHEAGAVHGALESIEDLSKEDRKDLLRSSIFARVSPKQKLDLISLHQQSGSVVAMTGDGVNDAPALKKADIGIAMGKRGTQVAREASDVILKDDAFGTIVIAIEQGRAIFENIRKFIVFLLSGNVGEIMIISFAMLLATPLPLKPLQILYLNMLGDVFPALALAMGRGHPALIHAPPRPPDEPLLTRAHWTSVLGYGLLIASTVFGGFLIALHVIELPVEISITCAFLSLAFARLWHVFNMRHRSSGIFNNEISGNPWVWGALVLCSALLVLAVYIPGISTVLALHHPGAMGWLWILGLSLVPWIVMQPIKSMGSRGEHNDKGQDAQPSAEAY
ncbi:MAG: cation-transporting P-type ATPase [Desulfomonilia bacterium]|nr:cation-transporting P-type ATPase [Desulfomonilia bacterium]